MASGAKKEPLMDNLRNLFAECDADKSGSLTRDEFRQLCLKIGLDDNAASKTFERLDVDKDNRITFEEFSAGFNKFQRSTTKPVNASSLDPSSSPQISKPDSSSRLSPSLIASKKSASPIGMVAIAANEDATQHRQPVRVAGVNSNQSQQNTNCFLNSGPNSCDFNQPPYSVKQQHSDRVKSFTNNNLSSPATSNPFDCVVYTNEDDTAQQFFTPENFGSRSNSQFSSLTNGCDSFSINGQPRSMQDLMDTLQKLQSENQMLSQVLLKDRKERDEYISQLGEEFDSQVKEVEERYSRKAKDEVESERKKYKQMIQLELDKLQSHYAKLESMAQIIKAKATNNGKLNSDLNNLNEDVNYKLETTNKENKKLEKSLQDTKSEVASIRQEMERLKEQYEQKLKNANAKNDETLNKCDDIKQQLKTMENSNKKLQDTSDAITSYIEQTVEPVLKNALDEDGNLLSLTSNASAHELDRRGSILSDYLLEDHKENDNDNNQTKSNSTVSSFKNNSWSIKTEVQSKQLTDLAKNNQTKNDEGNSLIECKSKHHQKIVDKKISTLPAAQPALNKQEVKAEISSKPLSTTRLTPLETINEIKRGEEDKPIVEEADGEAETRFHVILVGDSFVGKSSFASRFIGGTFKKGLISNCSIDFSTKNYKVDGVNYGIDLWDTAGQERFRSITASYFRKADGIILMYDVTEKRSYLNVRNWMSTIADSASENVVVLLVGNKIDLRTSQNMKSCVPFEEGARLAAEYEILFLETSVKTGENLLTSIGKLIMLIAKKKSPVEEDKDKIKLNGKNRNFACMPKNC